MGFQELEGRKKKGTPSDWADRIFTYLGVDWGFLVPTTNHNENYIVYRREEVELVEQLPDVILSSPAGGRHLSRAIFRERDSGRKFWVGNTHLVEGSKNAASRTKQIQQIVKVLPTDMPFVMLGDMNRSDTIKGFGTRAWPSKGATHTTYSASVRTTNPDQEFDHIYASVGVEIRGFNLVGVIFRNNQFNTSPRPSDHLLVIASLRFPAKD